MKKVIFAFLLFAFSSFALSDTDKYFIYTGSITDSNDTPIAGVNFLTVRIYSSDDTINSTPISTYSESIEFEDGTFQIKVPFNSALTTALSSKPALYATLEVATDGEMQPPIEIGYSMRSYYSEVANEVLGDINPKSLSINGQTLINEDGQFTEAAKSQLTVGSGTVGPQGEQGPKGDTGATGPKGEKGEKGDIGLTGPKGDTGAVGPTGPRGEAGPKGDKGDKGEKGDPGPAVNTVSACMSSENGNQARCSLICASRIVSSTGGLNSSCTAISDNGSCSISGYPGRHSACCVCAP